VSRPSEGCSEGQLGGMPAFVYTLFFINIMDKDRSLKQECTSIDFFFFLYQSYSAEKAYIATQGKKTKSFYYYLNVITFNIDSCPLTVSRPSEGCSEGQLGGIPAFVYTLFFINIMDKDQIAIHKCPLLQT
jgi:hypothetical protein